MSGTKTSERNSSLTSVRGFERSGARYTHYTNGTEVLGHRFISGYKEFVCSTTALTWQPCLVTRKVAGSIPRLEKVTNDCAQGHHDFEMPSAPGKCAQCCPLLSVNLCLLLYIYCKILNSKAHHGANVYLFIVYY